MSYPPEDAPDAPEPAPELLPGLPFDRAAYLRHPAAQATDAYVLEAQVGHLIRRAHQRHVALFTQIFGVDGLTPMQYAALVKIGDQGEVSQNLLGRLVAMDPATSQGVVKRLIEHGLVARKDDPHDRRRAVLSLTAAGTAAVAEHVPLGRVATEETLAPLSAAERAQFLQLLLKLT